MNRRSRSRRGTPILLTTDQLGIATGGYVKSVDGGKISGETVADKHEAASENVSR
jgi:hypothetical protein